MRANNSRATAHGSRMPIGLIMYELKYSSSSSSVAKRGCSNSNFKARAISRMQPRTLRLAVGPNPNSAISCSSASTIGGCTPMAKRRPRTARRKRGARESRSRAGTNTDNNERSLTQSKSCLGRVNKMLAYQSPRTVVGARVCIFAGSRRRRKSFWVQRSVTISHAF